jgi:hypothetical protein
LTLSACLVLAPGCRGTASLVYDGYAWSNEVFTPNPVSMPAYFGGLALGFIAGLPLCLFTWPAAAIGYPEEDGREFYISAALAPAISLGTWVGTLLGAPFYLFGAPFVPDDQDPPPGPEPVASRGPG